MGEEGEDEANEEHDGEGLGFRSPVEKGLSLVANIFLGVIKIVKAVITPFIYLIGGVLLIATFASWLGITASAFFVAPHVHFFSYGPDFLGYIGLFNAGFAIGIPFFLIILSIAKFLFGFKTNSTVTTALIIFAVINFFSLASIVGSTGKDFKVTSESESVLINGLHDADTIHLHIVPGIKVNNHIQIGDDIEFIDDQLHIRNIDIEIKQSDKNDFEVVMVKSAMGNNSVAAAKHIDAAQFEVSVEGNHFYIPENYVIEKGDKFRAQEINLLFKVPEGKFVALDKSVKSRHLHRMDIDEAYSREFSKEGMVWKMGDAGLTNDVAKREQIEAFEDFDKLDISGNFRIYIEQSDKFEIKTVGAEESAYKTEVNKVGGMLEVRNKKTRTSNPIKLYIKMPKLESIKLSNTHDVKIMDFKGAYMLIQNEGFETEIEAFIDIENLELKLAGERSELELHGTGKSLIADVGNHVTLDAGTYLVEEAVLNGEHIHEAYINASKNFTDNSQFAGKVVNKYNKETSENITIDISLKNGLTIQKETEQE